MSNIEIPISKLVLSERYQARKTPGQQPISSLADSIYAQGLLQNLVVTKAKKRGYFEVVAGGRRLAAMQMLVNDGRWQSDQIITAKHVDDAQALEASITENVQRENMHPADEFEAFASLIEEGRTIEDIAARFGVTPQVVKGRMRLAHVAPELLQAYRDEEMTLAVLMAFTIVDDQDRQRALWDGMQSWDRKHAHPGQIRARLTDQAPTAAHHLVQYIGLDAYLEAGGPISSDLFAGDDNPAGTYLQDVALLERLATEKLQAEVERLSEGWAWGQGALSFEEAAWSGYENRFGKVIAKERKLTKEEAKQVKDLTAKIDALSAKMDELAENDGDDDEWSALEQEHDALQEQREGIHQGACAWPQEAMAIAGVGVYIQHNGTLHITYGLIRPEDRKAVQAAAAQHCDQDGIEAPFTASLPAAATRPVHSEKLVRQLTANKVGIVGVELARRPDIALAYLVAQLTRNTLGQGYWAYGDYGLGVSLKSEAIDQHAPDFSESAAGLELAKYRQHWLDVLPLDEEGEVSEGVLTWALEQDTQTLTELLAYLLALSVQGVAHTEGHRSPTLDGLATTLGVDFANWWKPTAQSYLSHVSKDQISSVVVEALDEQAAAPLAKLKKAQAVELAQQLLDGTRWLPSILRSASAD